MSKRFASERASGRERMAPTILSFLYAFDFSSYLLCGVGKGLDVQGEEVGHGVAETPLESTRISVSSPVGSNWPER